MVSEFVRRNSHTVSDWNPTGLLETQENPFPHVTLLISATARACRSVNGAPGAPSRISSWFSCTGQKDQRVGFLKSRFKILPVAFFGRSATNSTNLGFL